MNKTEALIMFRSSRRTAMLVMFQPSLEPAVPLVSAVQATCQYNPSAQGAVGRLGEFQLQTAYGKHSNKCLISHQTSDVEF